MRKHRHIKFYERERERLSTHFVNKILCKIVLGKINDTKVLNLVILVFYIVVRLWCFNRNNSFHHQMQQDGQPVHDRSISLSVSGNES